MSYSMIHEVLSFSIGVDLLCSIRMPIIVAKYAPGQILALLRASQLRLIACL